jgi:D-alanine-D-alanine ligase
MRIAVLMGGGTSEHEISLLTGRAVAKALDERGHEVRSVELERNEDLLAALDGLDVDVVFVALHGGAGEDGRVQAVLELAGIRYVGSGPGASAVAMDKVWTKQIAREVDVPTTEEAVFAPDDEDDAILDAALSLGPATVFKPVAEGSAVGVHLCPDVGALRDALGKIGHRTRRWMLEPYVAGRELTVGIVLGQACPVIEIRPKQGFYDYTNKYTAGRTEYDCPAELSDDVSRRVANDALRLSRALHLRDMARIDFRLDPQNRHFLLEANTIPGMTATSLLPKGAQAMGIEFGELCERLCGAAAERATTRL